MPNYNQDIQSNNAELDAILETINNLPEAGQTKPEVAGTGKIVKNGKQTFTPPAGSVFSDFTADVEVPDVPPVVQELTVKKNGQYLPPEGVDGFSEVNVQTPEPLPMQEKTAEAVTNGPIVLAPDPGKAMSKATVNIKVPSDKKPEQEKELTINENGDVTITPDVGKVFSKVLAHVNIPTGGGGGGIQVAKGVYIPSKTVSPTKSNPIKLVHDLKVVPNFGIFTEITPNNTMENGIMLIFTVENGPDLISVEGTRNTYYIQEDGYGIVECRNYPDSNLVTGPKGAGFFNATATQISIKGSRTLINAGESYLWVVGKF